LKRILSNEAWVPPKHLQSSVYLCSIHCLLTFVNKLLRVIIITGHSTPLLAQNQELEQRQEQDHQLLAWKVGKYSLAYHVNNEIYNQVWNPINNSICVKTYSPTKTLKASYIPHWAPVRVPIITIRRGRPRVKRPHKPSFFTACITWYMTLKKLDVNIFTDLHYTGTKSDTHITNCCSFSIVQKRDKIISRMRHDCTKHTSNISTSKTDTELQAFAALILWSRNGMLIEQLNYGLKWSKLHHCVCRKEPFLCYTGHIIM